MPLFMLISGYLFYFTIQKHSYKYNLKTRFMGLLLPIIIWQTLWILLGDFYNPNNHNVLFIFNSYLNTLWFITSVFLNSLIVLLCNKYAKDSLLLYGAVFFISLFVPNYHGYNLYVFMLPYFLCGYLYNKTGGIKIAMNWKKEIICFIFFFILFSILLYHYGINDYAYTSGTYIMKNHMISVSQIYTDIFRWTIGFIGSLCVILLTKLICNTNVQSLFLKSLGIIGTKTMGLYIISTYLFKLFYLLPINDSNYRYIIIECIIVTLISYMLTWLIEQNKYSRKFLLGGR
jgi:fucose 4-O-acetylase-like acetyltransferase